MMKKFDAIVVGAGPAGSLAAYELARKGHSVLILEKSTFPRYKVCGGGLTYKILQELPFDVTPVVESTVHSIRFSKDFETVFTRTSEVPLIYCTMRERLDQFLLQKALDAGASIEFQQVTALEEKGEHVVVKTKLTDIMASLVIGADGPSSIVARSAGLRKNIEQGLAWEAEVYVDQASLQKYKQTVFLDWGTFPGGYGWVFPKKDHFSIGVGGPASLSKQMMPYYERFCAYIGFENPKTVSLKSWPIPVRTQKGDFHHGRIIVAGDAGGLTDGLTGEGIYYAVASGKMAGRAGHAYLSGDQDALRRYSAEVNDRLMSELLEGLKIRHIFNAVPMKIHTFVRDSERAWRAFGKVLQGERNYSDVKHGFGKWKVFWNLAAYISFYIEKWKEKRARSSF